MSVVWILQQLPRDIHSFMLEIGMGLEVIIPGATEKDWAI